MSRAYENKNPLVFFKIFTTAFPCIFQKASEREKGRIAKFESGDVLEDSLNQNKHKNKHVYN
jgi:hypothetical protein